MVAFDLKADEAGDTAGQLWIIVNHDGHQLAMADMQDDASARDDYVLVPLSTFAIGASYLDRRWCLLVPAFPLAESARRVRARR